MPGTGLGTDGLSLHCLLRRIWAVRHALPFSLLGACSSLTLPSQKESEPQLPEPRVTVAFRVLATGILAWVGDSWGPSGSFRLLPLYSLHPADFSPNFTTQ